MSTKKIGGWLDDRPGIDLDMGWATVLSYEPAPSPSVRVVTLVIHSGERDTVHTGAEVREMMREIVGLAKAYEESGGNRPDRDTITSSEIEGVVASRGFTL